MVKRYLFLVLGAAVLYGCGGASGSGSSHSEGATAPQQEEPATGPVSPVEMRIGNVDLLEGTLDVFMTNEAPVGTFQFTIEGVDVDTASYEDFCHEGYVDVNGDEVWGGSAGDYSISPGVDRLLTRVKFTSTYQSIGISFSADSRITDLSGVEMESEWFGATDVIMSMIVDYGKGVIQVYMENNVDVGGFQFVLGGNVTVTGLSSGTVIPNDFQVAHSGPMVLGFTMTGSMIPAGEEALLIEVSFTSESPDPEVFFDVESEGCVISDIDGIEPPTYWGGSPLLLN